ncbi:hypothetical protein P171DRAFT_440722 [Karstenula rhodostoma CBS 690.94]|uniref:Uncharacterized protein n=1 Tax=Karstenula rhodostoma CBS 690.94 TaxID=1392251 RepID=A0A9P4UDY6_9PLEO|nr:hypothetical protein P171DRAFT_440722 [Karstenula rhodostoma CBS 690.94]
MSAPLAPSALVAAKASTKHKKKRQQAPTIPNQPKIKRIRGSFLELPGEVRNQIYNEYVQECVDPSAWVAALELANTCKQVRAEFLPLLISSLEKLWLRLDKFTELLAICSIPSSISLIVDEVEKQGKTFRIAIDDYRKVGILSIIHMVMQLRERPLINVRFKDTYLLTYRGGGASNKLNQIIKVLRQRPAGSDDVLSDIERLEVKSPGVSGVCFSPREVSVVLGQGWFLEITFKATLEWWNDDAERRTKVRDLVRRLGLHPVTAAFMAWLTSRRGLLWDIHGCKTSTASAPAATTRPKKQKKKGKQARRRAAMTQKTNTVKPSRENDAMTFHNASVATIRPRKSAVVKASFLKLPGEIRNQIYRDFIRLCAGPCALSNTLDLASTCKQVRAEFMPLLVFSLPVVSLRVDNFAQLLQVRSTSEPSLLDELVRQAIPFEITHGSRPNLCIRSFLPIVRNLHERPGLHFKFADTVWWVMDFCLYPDEDRRTPLRFRNSEYKEKLAILDGLLHGLQPLLPRFVRLPMEVQYGIVIGYL